MKYTYAILFTLLLLSSSPAGPRDALHTFTAPDGRTIKAAIIQYNAQKGTIRIEREDGARFWTDPSHFSEKDQAYIRQWIAVDEFMSSTKFKISAKRIKDKKDDSYTKISYEVKLDNRTSSDLNHLRIECRAYIRTNGYEGSSSPMRKEQVELHVKTIEAGKQTTIQLKPFDLFTMFDARVEKSTTPGGSQSISVSMAKTSEDVLKGVRIRVYGPYLGGERAYREWCYPSDAASKYKW